MIYLDNSATSLMLPEVKAAICEALTLYTGNPSALHTTGHLAHNAIERSRLYIAKLINAEPDEIIFTSGGSESNNTIIHIFQGEKIAVANFEHPSVIAPAKAYTNCVLLPVSQAGVIDDLGTLAQDTKLVSVMLANNEVGTIQNIKKLAHQAHARGAYFHTDATQAIGKIPVDVKDLDVDYMTISSHKIGGPVGVGALFVRKGAPFQPFILGGHQEKGRRAGTYDTVNIVGFGTAAKINRDQNLPQVYARKVRPLRDQFAKRIIEAIPSAHLNHSLEKSLPHLLNISFPAAEGESIQLYLDAIAEVVVSTGSACASSDGKPSHVLMALYQDPEIAHGSIRFSLSPETTNTDLDKVMAELPLIVHKLQQISTIKLPKTLEKGEK